jgi:O-antigen ligase
VNVLRKSITLSGRRYIWDRVITYAISKPWLGWGYETEAIERIKFTILGAHNGWLDMFYHGGIILLAVFSVLLVYAGYRLFKFRNVPAFVPIMLIMCFYIVRFIAEPLPSTISFGMLLATMLIAMNVQLVYTQIKMIDKPQRDRHEQAFENSTYLYIQ